MLMKTNASEKFISCLLVAALAASSASCSSGKRKYDTLKESDNWYGCSSFNVDDQFPGEDYNYVDYQPVGVIGDKVYILTGAEEYFTPSYDQTKEVMLEEYSEHFKQSLLEFSFDGELTGQTDYNNDYNRFIQKAWISDNKINILEMEYDVDNSLRTYYLNGEELALPDIVNHSSNPVYLNDLLISGDYKIFCLQIFGEERIYVTKPDGSYFEPRIDTIVGTYQYFLGELMHSDDGKVLITCYTSDSYDLIHLDPVTGEMEEYKGIYGPDSLFIEYVCGKTIARDTDGFKLINGKSEEPVKLLDYSETDANMMDLVDARMFYISDDCNDILFGCTRYDSYSSYGGDTKYTVFRLNKAATNPHAGKTVLTVTNDEESVPDYSDFDAILSYNKNNDSYFIKYVISSDMEGNYQDQNADIIYSDKMTADPSDSAKYIDLAPYLGLNSGSFEEDYFINAFNAAKSGDAIYRVPLDISASGIITVSTNVSPDQKGFTFDSYTKFVDEICNGIDPISSSGIYLSGKPGYLNNLFMNMSDIFIKDGKANLEGEEFRELMMYVDKHGSEKSLTDGEMVAEHNAEVEAVINDINNNSTEIKTTKEAKYGVFYSIDEYISSYEQFGDGIGVYGLPSFDARGPMTVSDRFVSVSADTAHPEACAEFVKLLLSYDIQVKMSTNPINVKALRTVCEDTLNLYNTILEKHGFDRREHPVSTRIPSKAVDNYINIMYSSYGGITLGSAIGKIISEEATSYFNGQKALDDVIPVMQKRVQTVLDENK